MDSNLQEDVEFGRMLHKLKTHARCSKVNGLNSFKNPYSSYGAFLRLYVDPVLLKMAQQTL